MTIHQFSIREDTLDGGRCDKYGTGNNPVLCIQNKGASAQIRALEGGLGCCCQKRSCFLFASSSLRRRLPFSLPTTEAGLDQ